MDTYKSEQTPKARKRSPYADSPYECAYVEPEVPARVENKTAGRGGRRIWKVVIALLVIVACCAGTAVGVSYIWQGRMDLMEAAMEDRFDALKQLYNEKNNPQASQQPSQGAMTPSQVYTQSVDAVVAISSWYADDYGYSESRGSGFIISADGYVVTNSHVIEDAYEVTVTTYSGQTMTAEVVGNEPASDIALLKVLGNNFPYLTIGSSDAAMVGDQVIAIGNPLGELNSSLTVGYISAKDRIVDTDGTSINMLQTDAAINAGNSGGPLLNTEGQVIGIITAKYSGSASTGASIEGLGFAIPTDDVIGMIKDLQEFGYVTGAYMGVYVRDVDVTAQYYGLPAGAYVEDTMPGMAASRGGICAGDIIVNVGGYDVDCVNSLTRVLRRFKAGDRTTVTVYRSGSLKYLMVRFDEKPVEETVPMPEEGDYEEWFDFFFPEG